MYIVNRQKSNDGHVAYGSLGEKNCVLHHRHRTDSIARSAAPLSVYHSKGNHFYAIRVTVEDGGQRAKNGHVAWQSEMAKKAHNNLELRTRPRQMARRWGLYGVFAKLIWTELLLVYLLSGLERQDKYYQRMPITATVVNCP